MANSRKLRLIYENPSKMTGGCVVSARVARVEPALLAPVVHRGEATQKDLTLLRSRDVLVRSRTQLINHVRGIVKSVGSRLPACSSRAFSKKVSEKMPESLRPGLLPVLEEIASLSDRMKKIEKQLETLGDTVYPQTKLLRQVTGVGLITSLGFVLTLETPQRFQKSRTVAAFLGLVPGRKQSGGSDPERRITKHGTASCGSFSSMPPTTSSDPSERTRTCAALACESLLAAERLPRRKPSSPSPASWPSCFITSGARERSMSLSTRRTTRPTAAERQHEPATSAKPPHLRKTKT